MVTFIINMMQYSVNIEQYYFFLFYITNNAGPLLFKLMLKTPSLFFTDKQYMLNDVRFCIIYTGVYTVY